MSGSPVLGQRVATIASDGDDRIDVIVDVAERRVRFLRLFRAASGDWVVDHDAGLALSADEIGIVMCALETALERLQ